MLQIVTGMYFRDVELNETVHRAVLHTNAHFLPRDPVALPVGELRPSTDWSPVTTVTVEVIERLEAVRPNGERDFLVATGGGEIVRDLAAVLSFALNATFDPDGDLVRRLTRQAGPTGVRARRTCCAGRSTRAC